MKIEVLELTNHVSHEHTRVELNGARLATFSGPNGAGKSSLLESIKYVLFDDARARTDDLVRIGATDMAASLTFTFGGQRYRAVRGRTTKAGGKSFLELHVEQADGAWLPLTGDDIRSTQARIRELIGVDADTFAVAVFLGQGQANRFAESSPADRKRVLSQVLGLDRYARAEARTRELARDAEARIAAERSTVLRLDEQLRQLDDVDGALEQARRVLADTESELAQQGSARIELEEQVRALDAALATAQTAAATVARLEAERTELGEDWHRANSRKLASQQAIAAAEAIVADAVTVDAAAARLPALRLAVETATSAQKAHHDGLAGISAKRLVIDQLAMEFRGLQQAWLNRTQPLVARIATLEEEGKHAERVTCPKCGEMFAAGQQRILDALTTSRAELKAAGAEPKEPLRIAQERAALVRLEERQRESGYDPAALTRLQAEVVELTAIAARGESIEAARATVTREKAAVIEAALELARISAKGRQLAAALEEAKAVVELAAPLQARRAVAAEELRLVVSAIDQLGLGIREGERAVAAAEANVARRDQLDEERAQRAGGVDALSGELDLLRRLVGAFGVAGIPARIIESVLPELSAYANELLAELRPGMTLELRAQRAAKDGKKLIEALDLVVRDDVGERGLGLFSGGERMSVSLAIAVGLSRLVARRAGTAIRTLVIDEPDGLDADARRAFGQALRVLAHHGELERVVLISHHEDLADVGDAVYRVSKNGAGSVVEQLV